MDIIMISIVCGIDRRSVVPSTINDGRSEGTEPNSTTNATPRRKASTARLAYFSRCFSSGVIAVASGFTVFSVMSPSCKRRWYSGSSSNSLPTRFCTKADTRIAMNEAGMQTSRMSFSSMPLPPNRSVLMTAAVAADMGLPVMPSEAAIVATVMGRSGRILLSRAISEMMGKSE